MFWPSTPRLFKRSNSNCRTAEYQYRISLILAVAHSLLGRPTSILDAIVWTQGQSLSVSCGQLIGVERDYDLVELRCPQYLCTKAAIVPGGIPSLQSLPVVYGGIHWISLMNSTRQGNGQVTGLSGRKGAGPEYQSNKKKEKKMILIDCIKLNL